MELKFSAFIFIFIYAVSCSPIEDSEEDAGMQNDNYENYDDTEDPLEESKMPDMPLQISTRAEKFIRDLGETVVLPCTITGSKNFIQVWRKSDAVLFQSGIKMAATSNMQLLQNGSLVVSNLHPQDAGKYQCMALDTEQNSPSIQHNVILRVPPQIESLTAKDNITLLRNGDTLILTCKAAGYPEPVVSWHKGSSRFNMEGETLEIPDVKHHNAGTYKCLADNKIGEPAFGYINIKVEFKPIITIEKISVSSAHNSETELECLVHSEPRAQVTWSKDGMNIVSNERVQLVTNENRHSLVLKEIKDADFGVYSCLATNALGSTRKNVSLVQTPVVHQLTKTQNEGKVGFTWQVQSKSKLDAYEFSYRKDEDKEWKKFQSEGTADVSHDGGDIYEVKYLFNKALEPGEYHLRFRAQNHKGWSEEKSERLRIEVFAKHGHHKPHKKGHKHGKERQVTPTPTQPSQPDVSTAQQDKELQSGFIKESPSPAAAATDSSSLATPTILLMSVTLLTVRLASLRI